MDNQYILLENLNIYNKNYFIVGYTLFFTLGNELNIVLEKLDLKSVLHDMTNKTLSTLDVLNKTSLQNLCRERRLPTTGTKETLKNSLKTWMEENGVSSLVSVIKIITKRRGLHSKTVQFQVEIVCF